MTTNDIINKLDNHSALESLYQDNPQLFKSMLRDAIMLKPESETLKTWQARLSYITVAADNHPQNKLFLVIIIALSTIQTRFIVLFFILFF